MKPARSLALPALALPALAVGAAALATPALADDVPIQLVTQNNMPVPVYTDTQGGGSTCLRGLPGTSVPANGVVYVTMWMTCQPMRGQQVFIPSVAGPEVRTNVGFGFKVDPASDALDFSGGTGASPALSVSVSGFDARTITRVELNLGNVVTVQGLSWKWTIDCPAAGCPKP
ncbi:hypothetical protein [Phenylobacterium sp.]|uniref:hypothetical protein n=1 Tax=Phenylobacterium sp. TaxID=1871053 RepID=UPI00394A2BBB